MKQDVEEDLHLRTEDILKKIQEQMRLAEEALNFERPKLEEVKEKGVSKSMTFSKSKKNPQQNLIKIKDPSLDFVNLEENYSKKPDNAPFDDCCSICSAKIYYIKYICVICENCILCPKCEIGHEHPVLKSKFNQLSTLKDIYIYINTKNEEIKKNAKTSINPTGFLGDIFSSKFELKIECNSNSFSMRPNQKREIPITIQNLSSGEFDCEKNKLFLFGRNNKDLIIYTTYIKQKINKNEQIDASITIESKSECKVYDFNIELFSLMCNKLKSNILNFKVEVNVNQEDEKINQFFTEYPKIMIESLKIKKGVKKIMNDSNNKYQPYVILHYLKNNGGDVDETYYELMNNSNINNNIK